MGLFSSLFGSGNTQKATEHGQRLGQEIRQSDPHLSAKSFARIQSQLINDYAASHTDKETEQFEIALYYAYTGDADDRVWCSACNGYYLPHEH